MGAELAIPKPPLLVFDGECGFCTAAADWFARRARRPVRVQPWQRADLDELGLTEAEVRRDAWWLDGGCRARAHRAIGEALGACDGLWPLVGRAILKAPISWLAALGYRLVARWRGHLPGTTPACERDADRRVDPPGRPPPPHPPDFSSSGSSPPQKLSTIGRCSRT